MFAICHSVVDGLVNIVAVLEHQTMPIMKWIGNLTDSSSHFILNLVNPLWREENFCPQFFFAFYYLGKVTLGKKLPSAAFLRSLKQEL